MVAHVALFWGSSVHDSFKRKGPPDPHYQVSYGSFLFFKKKKQLNLIHRRCKNTKKIPGGGMLSYFV